MLLQAGGLDLLCPACEEAARRLGWLHFLRRLALEPKLLSSVTSNARGHLTCASPPHAWSSDAESAALPNHPTQDHYSLGWGDGEGMLDILLH